ncbi:MAG: hypothetical protein ACR2NP_12990 [Pirellulaceae bacterium]
MGQVNGYGAILFLVTMIGCLLAVGDQRPDWQITSMMWAGALMTLVALTFDRFRFQAGEDNGFFAQMKLYGKHLIDVDQTRSQDRVACLKIPLVWYLPLGLVMLMGHGFLEACGLMRGGWNMDKILYWLTVNFAALSGCLIYALLTTPLRRQIVTHIEIAELAAGHQAFSEAQ